LPEKVQDVLDNAPREGLSDHLMQQLQSLLSQYLELAPLGPLDRVPSVNDLTSGDVNGLPDIGLRLMPFAVAGVFPQGSTAIFQDYERLIERVQTGQVDLGVLDDLLEAAALRSNVPSPPIIDIDSTPDRELNTVLPSDSSQDQVLLEAQRAEAVVVRGPPGTGKSQVITNLIANALSKGERVLVVCQKRAALDVVQQRLGRVGLADAAVIGGCRESPLAWTSSWSAGSRR
ncbi:MAG: hypothetical protein MUE65_07360, partial [Methanomassiliicoccales archaeon]|nr:hypothetical protein [Methanomassiliicoccales archaeon]